MDLPSSMAALTTTSRSTADDQRSVDKVGEQRSTDRAAVDEMLNSKAFTVPRVPTADDDGAVAEKYKITGKRAGRGVIESGLTHECGVFGAIATGEWPTQIDISQVICLGLVALQHRGQESAGIVTSEGAATSIFPTSPARRRIVSLSEGVVKFEPQQ